MTTILYGLGIYFTIMFINFLYINKEDYESNGPDMIYIIFGGPIFMLYNIAKYGSPVKLPKLYNLFKKSKPEYTGGFRWGDLVTDNEGRAGVYVGHGRIVYENSSSYDYVGTENLSIQYRGEVSEELAMLDEAQKLQKKANELLAKKKKTIYN